MKTGQLFWGIFFLTLGGLYFLDEYDLFYVHADLFYDLWPLIIIFVGGLILASQSKIKPVISALFAFFIALLLFSFFNGITSCDDDEFFVDDFSNSYSEDYTSDIKSAELTVNTGAGSVAIDGETQYLIEGKSNSNIGNYDFFSRFDDDRAILQFSFEQKNFRFWRGKKQNKLKVELNPNPIWTFDINIGAAKSKFDLSPFKVKNFILNTGATNTDIKFGGEYSKTYVELNMGAASVDIKIPNSSGCKLTGDYFLVGKGMPSDMNKTDEGYYISKNYNNAESKILIVINGAASSVDIDRY